MTRSMTPALSPLYRTWHRGRHRLLAAASIAALSGCLSAPEMPVTGMDDRPLGETAQLIRTELIENSTVVVLEGGRELVKAEQNRLLGFLSRHPAGYGTQMTVTASPGVTETGLQALSETFDAAGTPVDPAAIITDPGLAGTAARVTLRRAQAVPPTCPHSLRGEKRVYGVAPEGFMGCANAAALAQMIADPSHLDQGVAIGTVDPAIMADHIRALRGRGSNVLQAETAGFSATDGGQ